MSLNRYDWERTHIATVAQKGFQRSVTVLYARGFSNFQPLDLKRPNSNSAFSWIFSLCLRNMGERFDLIDQKDGISFSAWTGSKECIVTSLYTFPPLSIVLEY